MASLPPQLIGSNKRHDSASAHPTPKRQKHTQLLPQKRVSCAGTPSTPPCHKTFTTNRAHLRHLREDTAHRIVGLSEVYMCSNDSCRLEFPRKESRDRHEKEQHMGQHRARKPNEPSVSELDQAIKLSGYGSFVDFGPWDFDNEDMSSFDVGIDGSMDREGLDSESHDLENSDGKQDPEYLNTGNPEPVDDLAELNRAVHSLSLSESVRKVLTEVKMSNPRNVSPTIRCTICYMSFETTDHEVLFKHLDSHFQDLTNQNLCEVCQIGFANQHDLQRHLQSSYNGDCGFTFKHREKCSGHHPPLWPSQDFTDNDRFSFCYRLRNWEHAQLSTFRGVVGELEIGQRPVCASAVMPHRREYAYSRSVRGCQSAAPNGHKLISLRVRCRLHFNEHPMGNTKAAEDTFDQLHRAVCTGSADLVRYILQSNPGLEQPDLNGLTPLHYAVHLGFATICEILLDHGASPNAEVQPHYGVRVSPVGATPLHMACQLNEAAEQSLAQRAANRNTIYPLYPPRRVFPQVSEVESTVDIIKMLLRAGAVVPSKDFLGGSILSRDTSLLLEIVGSSPKPPKDFMDAALSAACQYGDVIAIRFIIENGGVPDAECLEAVVTRGKHDMAEFLLIQGVDTGDTETPLYLKPLLRAVDSDDQKMIELLLLHGAELNPSTDSGQGTPLMRAIKPGSPKTVEILLHHGADVNFPDIVLQETPILRAIGLGYQKIVEILLNHGADVNATITYLEGTPLMSAVYKAVTHSSQKYDALILLLITHGADVHLPSRYGSTGKTPTDPLTLAKKYGRHDLAQLMKELASEYAQTQALQAD